MPYFAFLLTCILASANLLSAQQRIAPDAKEITVRGCQFVSMKDGLRCFQRFDPSIGKLSPKEIGFNWQKAKGTTGVRLFFKTDSPRVTIVFELDKTAPNRGSDFGVFIDGQFHKSFKFSHKDGTTLKLEVDSGSAKMKCYEVTLPTFATPCLKGIEIAKEAKMQEVTDLPQKVYVALGDSITHGRGQGGATYRTYPYLLAKKLGYDYYNLAVGGGKISVPAGRQLKGLKEIDLISILIGYNDWVFNGKTPEVYKDDYRKLLRAIRAHHPNTKIYCIGLLYTRTTKSRKLGETYQPEDYRAALASLVKEFQESGDQNIFFIQGDRITSEKNLQGAAQPKDPVHLGIPGAEMFAKELYKIIR